MRGWVRSALIAVVLSTLLGGQAAASADFHSKEWVEGAITTWSDCPWDGPITQPICRDYRVFFARLHFTEGGGPTNRAREPFRVILEISTFDVAADELIGLEVGETTSVLGTHDEIHLTATRLVSAAPIPLFDVNLANGERTPSGRTATVGPITWIAIGPRQTFGSSGPVLEGAPRHTNTECEVLNLNFHQKFRPATLDVPVLAIEGTPVTAPFQQDPAGYVIDNWFHIVHVAKAC